jgi:hypothetical protein
MLAAQTTTWDYLAYASFIGRLAGIDAMSWEIELDGSYDDAQVGFSLMLFKLTLMLINNNNNNNSG